MEIYNKAIKTGKKKNCGFISDVIKNKFSYLIALPAIIYIFIFGYSTYPYIVIAFQKYSYENHNIWAVLTKGQWVGFENFQYFFASQNAFIVTFNTIFLNILFISSSTIAAVVIALMLSELKNKKFVKTTQAIMLFPSYISWVVVSYILLSLFSSQFGLVDKVLVLMGIHSVSWYTDARAWPAILTVMRLWKGAGMHSIIYLAAIIGIDSSMYEAARMDGASRWQQMCKITIPMILPTIFILTLLNLGRIMFGDFGMIYALIGDNGTLYSTTDIIDTYIFRALRQVGDPSQAMAIGLFQSVIGFILVFGSNGLTRKFYPDGALY